MNAAYLNELRDHGASLITHIGLVDSTDTELAGGGYARQPVTWATPSDGLIRPNANLVFSIDAGDDVGGWRGYSASSGGTDYGGEDLDPETFTNGGSYTLLASQTSIAHNAV